MAKTGNVHHSHMYTHVKNRNYCFVWSVIRIYVLHLMIKNYALQWSRNFLNVGPAHQVVEKPTDDERETILYQYLILEKCVLMWKLLNKMLIFEVSYHIPLLKIVICQGLVC